MRGEATGVRSSQAATFADAAKELLSKASPFSIESRLVTTEVVRLACSWDKESIDRGARGEGGKGMRRGETGVGITEDTAAEFFAEETEKFRDDELERPVVDRG